VRACRVCGRLYPDDASFCPVDGQGLYSATQVPVSGSDGSDRVGQLLFERYQVRRVVADGGMGRVYEALDLVGQRHVALKVLHPEVAHDEVAVERFKREFEVSALLSSVHVVDVLDFRATRDGSFALVMEFLHGEELRATLRRERSLTPERIVRLLAQLALALDEAHDKRLVHRDLKPENLFLCQTSDGDIVKVLDFGSVRDNSMAAKKLTVMGTTIGSPYYMAPEQAQGLETLDRRADVWSLGAIVYECLTGEVPFKGVNGPSILLEILTKQPAPPSQLTAALRADVPAAVDAALLEALEKSAASRTATAGELADAFGRGYGLDGTHADWAVTAEHQLGGLIAARLPALMEHATVPRPVIAAGDPPPNAPEPARVVPSAPPPGVGAGPQHGRAPLPGASRPTWIAPVVVAVVALLTGVLLALLFI
jgi:eukaryotic-like serine/threonine-protein kinase